MKATGLVGLVLIGGISLLACEQAPQLPSESVGVQQEHIWNGTSDDGADVDPYRNAIVQVQSVPDDPRGFAACTGFLVTSELVVTAAHCVVGDTDGVHGLVAPGSPVWIGNDNEDMDQVATVTAALSMADHPVDTAEDTERDVALLVIDPPIVDLAYPQKPRFVVPPLNHGDGAFPLLLGGWGATQDGPRPQFRQLQYLDNQVMRRTHDESDDNFHIWYTTFASPYRGTDHGDSGGPLLWRYDPSDDNKWDLLGVASFIGPPPLNGNNGWADVTWPEGTRAWLDSTAKLGAEINGRWKGETDYTGPCQEAEDPDCDRIYNHAFNDYAGDNCPAVANPAQNIGGDVDHDHVPDYCDNCPYDANADQKDADKDGFGDECDKCSSKKGSTQCGGGCTSSIEYIDPLQPLPEGCSNQGPVYCTTCRCARDRDKDKDGVGDACDNCADDQNADQSNCNSDAESQLGLQKRGDACDPNPCSVTEVTTKVATGSIIAPACTPTTCPVTVTTGTGIEWHGVVSGSDVGASGKTRFAHCACDQPHSSTKKRVANCQTNALGGPRCVLGDHRVFPASEATPTPSEWRAITTLAPTAAASNTTSDAVLIPIGRGNLTDVLGQIWLPTPSIGEDHLTGEFAPSGSPVQKTRWLFDRDLAAFGIDFQIPSGGITNASQLTGVADALDGIGWSFVQYFKSLYPPNRDLASNYYAQDLDPQTNYNLPDITPPIMIRPPSLEPPGCLSCGAHLPSPWIAVVNDPNLVNDQAIAVGPDANWVTRPGFAAGIFEKLRRPAGEVELFGPSEGEGLLGERVGTERGALVNHVNGTVTVLHQGDDGGYFGDTPAFHGLPNVASRVGAFAASRGLLFLLSGNGSSAATVVAADTRVATFTQATITGVSAGIPLSATYRVPDESLYVADRLSSGALRILRVGANGAAVELGRLTDGGTRRTDIALSAMPDGNLLLSAAGSAWDTPLFMTLAVTDSDVRVISTRYDTQPGRLLTPPIASGGSRIAVAKVSGTGRPNFGLFAKNQFASAGSKTLGQIGSVMRARSGLDNCGFDTPSSSNDCVATRSLVLYASHQLLIDDRATTRGPGTAYAAVANGGTAVTNVGTDTQIGNVWTKGPMTLRDRGKANGFVRGGSSVVTLAGASISGAVLQNASVNLMPLDSFQLRFPAVTSGNVSLEPPPSPTAQRALEPGPYGSVTAKSGTKLSLRSGVYSFTALDLEPNATLSLDTSAGPVFVYVSGALIYRGRILNQSGPRADFFLGVFGTTPVVLEAPFVGTVVVPNTSLTLGTTSTGHIGSFFGKDVELRPQTNVMLESFNYPWVP